MGIDHFNQFQYHSFVTIQILYIYLAIKYMATTNFVLQTDTATQSTEISHKYNLMGVNYYS